MFFSLEFIDSQAGFPCLDYVYVGDCSIDLFPFVN